MDSRTYNPSLNRKSQKIVEATMGCPLATNYLTFILHRKYMATSIVNGTCSVCDQKTYKYIGIILIRIREGTYKEKYGEVQVEFGSQESMFLLFRYFQNL
jgi:hypothetical protein